MYINKNLKLIFKKQFENFKNKPDILQWNQN